MKILEIDKHILEHLAQRAFDEYYNTFGDTGVLIRTWGKQAPINKERWRIVAATVLTEANNVVKNGIKANDKR